MIIVDLVKRRLMLIYCDDCNSDVLGAPSLPLSLVIVAHSTCGRFRLSRVSSAREFLECRERKRDTAGFVLNEADYSLHLIPVQSASLQFVTRACS